MITTTFDSSLSSPTSRGDQIDGKSCKIDHVTAVVVKAPPTRFKGINAVIAQEPSKRYASWITSPLGPMIACFLAAIAVVVFAYLSNASGVLVSVVFVIGFLGLALFNAVTPDTSQST